MSPEEKTPMEFEPGIHQVLTPLQHLAEKWGYGSIMACATVVSFVAYYGYKAYRKHNPSDATTLEAFCKEMLGIFDKLPPGASLSQNGSGPYEVQLANYVVNSAEQVGYGKKLRKRIARSVRRVVLDSFGQTAPHDQKDIYYSTEDSLPADLRARLLHAMFRGRQEFRSAPSHNQLILWTVDGRRFRQASDKQLVRATLALIRERVKAMAKTATDSYNTKLQRAFAALEHQVEDRRPSPPVQRSSDRSSTTANGRDRLANSEA